MLAISKIKDLFAGKLSDQLAYQYLLELNNQEPSAAFINELITNIFEITDRASWNLESFLSTDNLIDFCGTGGSGIPRFNTSTAVAFVLAAGGLKVVKSGNRSGSSNSGSFDFLEALDIPFTI